MLLIKGFPLKHFNFRKDNISSYFSTYTFIVLNHALSSIQAQPGVLQEVIKVDELVIAT